jgi:hypothetical protein
MILTNMGGFLGGEFADEMDYSNIAHGSDGPRTNNYPRQFWETREKEKKPVKGIFGKNNPLRCSSYVKDLIHILGFVKEKKYGPRELVDQISYRENPILINETGLSPLENIPFRSKSS